VTFICIGVIFISILLLYPFLLWWLGFELLYFLWACFLLIGCVFFFTSEAKRKKKKSLSRGTPLKANEDFSLSTHLLQEAHITTNVSSYDSCLFSHFLSRTHESSRTTLLRPTVAAFYGKPAIF
jgi:predicted membrane protein